MEKEKRKYQKWQKDCHKFVRPYALEGDMLCVAHNPNCSGTLNMVKVFEKLAEWSNAEQRQELLSEHKKNKMPLHGVWKSLKIRYLLLFYQSIVW